MKKCEKCGKDFPLRVRILGKIHIINNRRYCLECSPFGKHNTQRLSNSQDLAQRAEPSSKICSVRHLEKPIDEFYLNHSRKTRHSECRTCFNKRSTEQQRRRKVEAIEYKGGKCMRCGFKGHIAALEFHHLNRKTKSFNIGYYKNRSFERLKDELDKCILLCSNCHRELESLGDEADWSFIK